MAISTPELIFDTDDAGLRRLTREHMKVLAQFTDDDCALCAALAPSVRRFAAEPEFADIRFLTLDAARNPVASHLMNQRAAPFFVSYCQGHLLECDNRTTEAEVYAQLQRLRAFVPQAR